MIMLSTPAMKRDLRALWTKSFPDSQSTIRFFFRYRYCPGQCLVLVRDNTVVSALHLLPAQIVTENGRSPVQYIYAAATLPEYRNTGCMTQLLQAAEDLGAARGVPYTALVPSGRSLFAYYERSGFVPYFETRTVRVSREELIGLARGGREQRAQVSSRLLSSVRTEVLRDGVGNLLWDRSAFSFAVAYQKISQGNVFSAAAPGYVGYAFFQQEEQTGVVTEAIAQPPVLAGLARQLQSACRSPLMLFRLPVDSPLFAGRGEISFSGMLKVNGKLAELPEGKHPYLGLELN
ncbi:MAG: GNAT family N-acetyltransferase [Firmicutes bacterium]|nr:GNAT family N-acetyltransferase [Bacillota bacterium]